MLNRWSRRKFYKEKLVGYSEIINDLFIQCAVYPSETVTRSYWINQISKWFDIVNTIRFGKNKRFTANFYRKYLFFYFGNIKSDAEVNIKEYRLKRKIKANNEYFSDFIVSNDKVNNLFVIYQYISEKYGKIFSNKKSNKLSQSDFCDMLEQDLKLILDGVKLTAYEIENIIKYGNVR